MTMFRPAALALTLAVLPAGAVAQQFVVPLEFWDHPRTGAAVLEQPAIREAARLHLEQQGSRLVLHHGATQESRLLADELRAWLMSLALDPSRVILQNDLNLREPLRIEVVRP